MMLLKCDTQYVSKFAKLSSGHRIGKVQFLFQSQRRTMPRSVQTIAQLRSFHMVSGQWSKSFKLGFNSMWTKNFQMYKLDLEKAEEAEIKLPTFIESWIKQESSGKNIYFYFIDYAKVFDCGSQQTMENSNRDGVSEHHTCLLRNMCAGQESKVRAGHDEQHLGKEYINVVYSYSVYVIYMQSTSCEMLGWMNHQPRIRLLEEILTTLDMQIIPL